MDKPLAHKAYDALVADSVLQHSDQPCPVDLVEVAPDVGIENPVHTRRADPHR